MKLNKIAAFSILNGLILMCLTLAEFLGLMKFEPVLSLQWHKVLHIAGVILFIGNMTVGPVWFMFAYYSRDKALLRFACRLLELTDLLITMPGLALTVLNGLCLASVLGGSRSQPWLFQSDMLLFLMWGLSFPLIFLQNRLFRAVEQDGTSDRKIDLLIIYWGILGTIVMIPPLIIFYLMVVKAV